MNQTEVTNLPTLAIWIVAVAQIVFALAMAAIAFAMISLLGQLKEILTDVKEMEREIKGKMPSMMSNIDATVGNVKTMSDDARVTTHHVTGTVNRVAHVTTAVVGRLESPLVRSVGVLTGVAAGLRALRGGKEREVIVEREDGKKKKGGLFGKRR